MPSGATYDPSNLPIQPGTYVAQRAKNPVTLTPAFSGTVLAFASASWGPANVPTVADSYNSAADLFGDGSPLATLIQQAYIGGAAKVIGFRFGAISAATPATYLAVGSSATSLAISAAFPGTRPLALELRDCPYDLTLRELRVFVDAPATLRQTLSFLKGTSGTGGELLALKAAIDASGNDWVVSGAITGTPAPATIMTAVGTPTPVAMAGGVNPDTTGTALSDGLALCETEPWKVLVADTIAGSDNATIAAYMTRIRGEGYRRMAIVTEGVSTVPASAVLATHQVDAKALNNKAVAYLTNGFSDADGQHSGSFAAARVAGMLAGTPTNRSLTHQLVAGATNTYDGAAPADKLNKTNVDTCLRSGMLLFSRNSSGQVQIEQGLTTLVTLDLDTDAGWQSLEIVRSRDDFVDRLVGLWDQRIGQSRNNKHGRAAFIADGATVLEDCAALETLQIYDDVTGAVVSQVIEDPQRQSSGRYAFFLAKIKSVGAVEIALIPITYEF